MHTIRTEVKIPGSLERIFDFFNCPENLEKMTPPSERFKMLTPSPVAMHNGAVFDYVIGLFGWPLRWTSVITGYAPPMNLLTFSCGALMPIGITGIVLFKRRAMLK